MTRVFALVTCCALLLLGCGDDGQEDVNEAGGGDTTEQGDDGRSERGEQPEIALTSPEPLDEVSDTLHLQGEATVFEATVNWHLEREGEVVQEGFVQAACGAPCRGGFDRVIELDDSLMSGNYELYVYSVSAKDGSRQHEVYVPITVTPQG